MDQDHIKLRLILGSIPVFGLLILAALFGLGTVREDTSHGLREIILVLSLVSSKYADWAFRVPGGKAPEEKKPEEPKKPEE